MKKTLISFLILGTLAIVAPAAEAKATATALSADPQIRVQIGNNRRYNRRYNRRTRVVTSTRTTWSGGVRYRETIRTTYFANGRTRTVVVNRVRLGGRRGIIRNY